MSRYIIDKSKLIENINIIKNIAGVEVIGVVKGNGYGFGMCSLAEILMQNEINTFAVTEVYDVPLLRETVIDRDILVMRSTSIEEEAKIIAENDCIATIGSLSAAEVMDKVSKKLNKKTKCHLKIDTGMGRYGFLPILKILIFAAPILIFPPHFTMQSLQKYSLKCLKTQSSK